MPTPISPIKIFSVATHDVCTGQIRINPALVAPSPKAAPAICKSNVLRRFLAGPILPVVNLTWVLGDNRNDRVLMRLCERAFVIDPKATIDCEWAVLHDDCFIRGIARPAANHEFVAQA